MMYLLVLPLARLSPNAPLEFVRVTGVCFDLQQPVSLCDKCTRVIL